MAHSLSSRKRWRQSLKRRDRNRSVKSRTRTLVNKAIATIGQDQESAADAVRSAVSALDQAAQKGVIHANAAARSKSRLLKRFNLATATAVAAAAGSTVQDEPKAPAKRTARKSATGKAESDAKPAAKRATRPRASKQEAEAAPEKDTKPRGRARKET